MGSDTHPFFYPLGLSFTVATLATALALGIGLPLGALLARRRFFGRDLFDAVLCLPLVLPPTVLGYYLLVLLSRRSFLGHAFAAIFGVPLTFTPAGAVLAALVHALPSLTKASRTALEDVDPLLLRAAASLGAGPLRSLWTVELPQCRRQLLAATLLVFARALGDFGVTLMIAGDIPGYTQTAALAIYDAVQAGRERAGLGYVAVLSIISLTVLYVGNKLAPAAHERSPAQ
jgi:molybdate transport system permease protein